VLQFFTSLFYISIHHTRFLNYPIWWLLLRQKPSAPCFNRSYCFLRSNHPCVGQLIIHASLQLGLVDGVVTEDSDAFLFGAQVRYCCYHTCLFVYLSIFCDVSCSYNVSSVTIVIRNMFHVIADGLSQHIQREEIRRSV
jgi:hypothetical protein